MHDIRRRVRRLEAGLLPALSRRAVFVWCEPGELPAEASVRWRRENPGIRVPTLYIVTGGPWAPGSEGPPGQAVMMGGPW
jgi:hypothetical protein